MCCVNCGVFGIDVRDSDGGLSVCGIDSSGVLSVALRMLQEERCSMSCVTISLNPLLRGGVVVT